jgi:hypothetical protein
VGTKILGEKSESGAGVRTLLLMDEAILRSKLNVSKANLLTCSRGVASWKLDGELQIFSTAVINIEAGFATCDGWVRCSGV